MPRNNDPFMAWNFVEFQNDPFAPHNDPMYEDDPTKPWNDPCGNHDDLTEEEKKYYGIDD